ncbi:2OG-Fe(II) oxygenase [Aphanothece sacrum]|uniref:2OG-Fe(II) oxygenase superfamily protein n=1 Tax=Aphanothece sacrum FPU1 TaxID=1920663 RepID=A0A401IJG6_APHSA|nr:2OG-Fe(II) oxygenase [Aphanothece sacrum]GBF81427.1 2OG-Fe(II) oxygenase superfamily protein [Aphanothece sacrum FPU1]GBF85558.1 2OG-Fe(II) oxygenase superfamily protein [Aphanothece sacrum FPU3]
MKTQLKFCLDADYLDNLAVQCHEQYVEANPFPHIVIDNFLPEYVLEQILDEFPQPRSIDWQRFDGTGSKKLASTSELQMGEFTRFFLYQLNSSIFINFLEKLTGIEGIIPDPHFQGGGLHQIERGGFLKMHVDFNRDRIMKVDRRLNLLIYLNKDWQEEYGGHFEMWNKDMTICVKKILPIFNRCVVFSTSDFSYHGHPDPLNCPEGLTRKSLALYYYSNGRPPEEISDSHTTLFKERPMEETIKKPVSSASTAKTIVRKILPPIVLDIGNIFLKNKP